MSKLPALDIIGLLSSYRKKLATPEEVIRLLVPFLDRDPALWISRRTNEELVARAIELGRLDPSSLPLYGIPFAVKDNIDVVGLKTTAACPEFAYMPSESAYVVKVLESAGAICIGKTNLDQFATGLVGTRSPYGIPVNACREDLIPGGSSSGSAVAVAGGLVSFSLGTDTAGSGRVPAALNGIYGWKPTKGLVSTRGVVPACRTLDCVSVFARNVSDLAAIQKVIAVFDDGDPYSHDIILQAGSKPAKIGVPRNADLEFFGDKEYAECWLQAVDAFPGDMKVEVDCSALIQAAQLLYGSKAWLAERAHSTQSILKSRPDRMLDVTRGIISKGMEATGEEVFDAFYHLAELKRVAEKALAEVDVLVMPTIGTTFTIEQVLADPIETNSVLGTYTNFMNLLDYCGLAIPVNQTTDGRPFGVTLIGRAGADLTLFALAGGQIQQDQQSVRLAVCGGHMQGLPLNSQLTSRGSKFVAATCTSPRYQLVQLDDVRPGLCRQDGKGASIELEIWELPTSEVGSFIQSIPHPLSIGSIELHDGSWVQGFLCEGYAIAGKKDISEFGGWRAWLRQRG